MSKTLLRTPLCDMLGIEVPVILAGMGPVASGAEPVANADLAAAVSEAGGLGVIGGVAFPPEVLRAQIRRVRELTDKPFGVDLLLSSNFLAERPAADSGGASATRVPERWREQIPTDVLDGVRRMAEDLGVEWLEAEPPPESWVPAGKSHAGAQIEVLLEEKVPVFASGLGSPAPFAAALKENGTRILSLVGNVRAARRVAEGGADIVVAQGTEAGGHTGRIGTLALLPQVMDAVAPVACGCGWRRCDVGSDQPCGRRDPLARLQFVADTEAIPVAGEPAHSHVGASERDVVVVQVENQLRSKSVDGEFHDAGVARGRASVEMAVDLGEYGERLG